MSENSSSSSILDSKDTFESQGFSSNVDVGNSENINNDNKSNHHY